MTQRLFVVSISLLFVNALDSPARAQTAPWSEVAVSAVVVDYDLSGVGQTAGVAVRASRFLSSSLAIEARGLFAKPEQQYGPTTLFIPEAQLQYRWGIRRLMPFVGGGLGAAAIVSDLGTDWEPTMSIGGGTAVRLNHSLELLGEMRLRGVDWDFAGSAAEWSVGLGWRLPGS